LAAVTAAAPTSTRAVDAARILSERPVGRAGTDVVRIRSVDLVSAPAMSGGGSEMDPGAERYARVGADGRGSEVITPSTRLLPPVCVSRMVRRPLEQSLPLLWRYTDVGTDK
jgi:hypothetical protein